MHPGGSAGQPAPAATGTVTGHSYTAAYRYQLVIGKVGGWAIPYPLTIPQAVTGLSTVVLAMVTASWWYPLTGISGALGVVILPILGIRVVSRIRPEGRSVSDWLYGWGVAQSHSLTGQGVRLQVGLPTSSADREVPVFGASKGARLSGAGTAPAKDREFVVAGAANRQVRSSTLPPGASARLRQAGKQSSPPGAGRARAARALRIPSFSSLITSRFPWFSRRTTTGTSSQSVAPSASPTQPVRRGPAGQLPPAQPSVLTGPIDPGFNYDRGLWSGQDGYAGGRHPANTRAQSTSATHTRRRSPVGHVRQPGGVTPSARVAQVGNRRASSQSAWSALAQFFTPTPAPAPTRVPVFDPWGVANAQGGTK